MIFALIFVTGMNYFNQGLKYYLYVNYSQISLKKITFVSN